MGLGAARGVLNGARGILGEKADVEDETIDEVIRVLKKEFEE